MTHFGDLNYVWGNMPGFDVLNIKKNEGWGYAEDIDMCFAGEYVMRRLKYPHVSSERPMTGWLYDRVPEVSGARK